MRKTWLSVSLLLAVLFMASSARAASYNGRYKCADKTVRQVLTNAVAKHLGFLEPWPTATKAFERKSVDFFKSSVGSDASYVDNSFWNTYLFYGGDTHGLSLAFQKTGGSTGANLLICEYEVPGTGKLDKKNSGALVGKSAYSSFSVIHAEYKRYTDTKKHYVSMEHWSASEARKVQGKKARSLVWLVIVESDSYVPVKRTNYNIFGRRK